MQSSTYYLQVISNDMTFSHNQLFYLSSVIIPLGKGISHAFHRLTRNNSTYSIKSWVRTLLLSSSQRLMAERNPFTLTQKILLGKRIILVLQFPEIKTSSSHHSAHIVYLHLRILTYNSPQ